MNGKGFAYFAHVRLYGYGYVYTTGCTGINCPWRYCFFSHIYHRYYKNDAT